MIKGNDLLVYINGTRIAASRTCSVERNVNTIPVCSPVDGPAERSIPTTTSWSISVGGLYANKEGAERLREIWRGYQDGVKTPLTIDVRTEGDIRETGEAILTSLQDQGDINSLVKFSVSLQGSGPLGDYYSKVRVYIDEVEIWVYKHAAFNNQSSMEAGARNYNTIYSSEYYLNQLSMTLDGRLTPQLMPVKDKHYYISMAQVDGVAVNMDGRTQTVHGKMTYAEQGLAAYSRSTVLASADRDLMDRSAEYPNAGDVVYSSCRVLFGTSLPLELLTDRVAFSDECRLEDDLYFHCAILGGRIEPRGKVVVRVSLFGLPEVSSDGEPCFVALDTMANKDDLIHIIDMRDQHIIDEWRAGWHYDGGLYYFDLRLGYYWLLANGFDNGSVMADIRYAFVE